MKQNKCKNGTSSQNQCEKANEMKETEILKTIKQKMENA